MSSAFSIPLESDDQFLDLCASFSKIEGTTLLASSEQEGLSYLSLIPYDVIAIPYFARDPWEILKERLGTFNELSKLPLWTGFLSYEMGAFVDKDKAIPFHKSSYPLAYFQKSALIAIYSKKVLTLVKRDEAIPHLSSEQKVLFKKLKNVN